MRPLFLTICLGLSFIGKSQNPVPLSSLPQFDCSMKKLSRFFGKPFILLTTDETTLKSAADDLSETFGNQSIRRTPTQMTDSDYHKPILLIGDIRKLPSWPRLHIPIKSLKNGFQINHQTFTDSTDDFIYMDSMHVVLGMNSLSTIKAITDEFTGGYDITILEKNKVTYFGNYSLGKLSWYNLQNLKTSNYKKLPSPLFNGIYLSKTYTDSIDFAKTESVLVPYAQKFLSIYHISMPKKKIDWFISTNMQEYGVISGLFNMACPGNNSAGFSIHDEIHTNGYNLPLVKHEYSHYLFDNNIPQTYNTAFFIEGSVEYVLTLDDTAAYKQKLKVARQYRDTLNYEDLIIRGKDFYGQYSGANYTICGVFVKYMVDTYGVEKFKAYCLAPDRRQATKNIFSKDFLQLISDYKDWLGKQ